MSKDEIELDLSKINFSKEKVFDFFKKYGVLFLILIPLLISIYLRMVPAGLPATDDWARSSVTSYYKAQVKDQIRQQYPNLPEDNVDNLAEQQYADFYKQNKDTIEQQVKETSKQFKSQFQDENGFTYMPDIDPYQWLRYARNYVDHGYVGDEIRDGVQWDNHMLAPKGSPASTRPHSKILAWMYEIMHVFSSKINLMQSASYMPVIFSALSVIPIFFIGRMFAGNIGGFFAALMLAVNVAFLGRTTWGHPDTDVYSIFFPVYFIWFVFLALKSQDIKKIGIYSALAGLSITLFGMFWPGWWYVFDFVLGMIVAYLIYLAIANKFSWQHMKENHHIRNVVIASVSMLVISGILLTIFVSPTAVIDSLTQPLGFAQNIKVASGSNLWPNVYTTVAELNSASFSSVINSIGGDMFFYISLLGILLLLLVKTEGKREYIPFALLIIFWYIGIIYASRQGIRFTMMLVPPIALAMGAAIGIIYKKTVEYLKKLNISPKITGTIFIAIVLLMFLPYIKGAAAAVKNDIPIVNDAWYNSLNKIKLESQPNAIINSWWDFGHHFKYFADRAVTFDGASQSMPMAHWIGKVLLTDDEKEAVGILRMLDCGSNDAFEILDKTVNDTPATIKLLYAIVKMDKAGAESYLLSNNVKKETADKVLEKTHCTPPEDYFITSGDMVGKSAVWAHFGIWDFDRADMWINVRNLPKDEAMNHLQKYHKLSEEDAKKIYYQLKSLSDEGEANAWIASWPGYSGQQGCDKQDNKLICGGYMIDLTTKDVQISTDKGVQIPQSIIYSENGQFIEKKLNGGVPQSVLLEKDGDSYRITIASPEVAASMFTRLFYFDGAGTSQFIKFDDQMQVTGERIIVWKVKW